MTTADKIPVYCAHTRIAKTATLKPHPRNPNTHPQAQIEIFAKVVQTLGWRAPIVVSKIACEQTGRHARAMDLEPKFVAVALERWHRITGDQPTLQE